MVTRYRKVYRAPGVSGVAGQSARARSSPLYPASPPLHSLPLGMRWASRPLTLGTRMLSNAIGPPLAATAARHAADAAAAPPSLPQATARLTGVAIAPCAWAGWPIRAAGTSQAAARAAAAARV